MAVRKGKALCRACNRESAVASPSAGCYTEMATGTEVYTVTYDGITMAAVCRELVQLGLGARVEKIYQPGQQEILLHLRKSEHRFVLLCSAHPRLSRVHLTKVRQDNPAAPPPFCMLLRKHLGGAKLLQVSQDDLERVLILSFAATDDWGQEAGKKLICEIMGKHSNLILTTAGAPGEERILGGSRAITARMSRHRTVLPGELYCPPPAQHKLSLHTLDEDELMGRLSGDGPPDLLLVNAIMGIGPETARELLFRAAGPEVVHPLELVRSLTSSLRQLPDILRDGNYTPCIARSPDGKIFACSVLRLSRFPGSWLTIYPSANEMLDTYYSQAINILKEQQLQQRLAAAARAALARAEKKQRFQEKELLETTEADRYRLYAELLTANFHLLQTGQKEAPVNNFYSPTQETILIPLDHSISPKENARRYFKKYRKLKDGAAVIRQQLETTVQEVYYLESVLAALCYADLDSLAEIQEEMEQAGLLPAPPARKQCQASSSPLCFVSADGIEILVGKNNRQNDLLTLKIAKGSDTWLHVKSYPGAHVVIRSSDPPEQTLLEAAKLAVRFSKVSGAGKTAVDYTLVKHVHKPKGARPGMAVYTNHTTILVTADP
jgi:predicted ribosome quality control (RQC) complex YloA/Tae2 family protein